MSIEKDLERELRLTKLRAVVLGSVKVAGILTFGALVPKVTATFLNMSARPEDRVRRVTERLRERGLVEITDRGISLTEKGRRFLARYSAPARTKRWDGRWRIVIFDVPESKRVQRTRLRESLLAIGFYRLQDSVWVYPFDCEDFVALLRTDFHIGKDVLYIIAHRIENDAPLRRHFALVQ